VVVTLNLAICTITPPIAVNLYVASNISGPSMAEVSRWILPSSPRSWSSSHW
jgi:TRAP-type C4-dicarboxylate transport system permease large subunit